MSDDNRVIKFPQSRVPGTGKSRPVKNLGRTRFAEMIDPEGRRGTGHWCSRCQGVWYGFPIETQCPVCGNRHG